MKTVKTRIIESIELLSPKGLVIEKAKYIPLKGMHLELDKPKWRFEYLAGVENILKSGLGQILKGVFEK